MRRASFLVNVIMAALISILAGTLVYTMFSYREQEAERTAALRREAERVRQEEEAAEAAAQAEQERIEQEEAEAAAAALPLTISCRGESWQSDGADREDGWPAMLASLLEEEEIEAEVTDYTWDMAGTLSQMRFADVSEEQVNAYVESHSNSGLRGVRIETTIRADLEEDYIEREDYESIPVICVGYNGGYGRKLDELIEQQGLILETYTLQEAGSSDGEREYNDGDKGISGKYLIIGHLPSGWNDVQNYERRMEQAWGDHFVSLNHIQGNVLSWDFREGVAQAVYDKMEELDYLEK